MASIAELRKKIKGVGSTRQITNAMKMVAGARFARAARQRTDALYYADELENSLFSLLSILGPRAGGYFSLLRAPGSSESLPPERTGLMVIAADKGLAGDFSNSILRAADDFLAKSGARVRALFAVGRKSAEHYKNSKLPNKIDHAHFFNRFDFGIADTIGQEALKLYMDERLDELVVVRSNFKSMIKQQVIVSRLLPVEPSIPEDPLYRCTITEPVEEDEVLETLLPMYLNARLYGFMRDSYAAELSARMRAMDNATRNAGTLIDTITLEMNKVRQAMITREIAEIIATNEVVK